MVFLSSPFDRANYHYSCGSCVEFCGLFPGMAKEYHVSTEITTCPKKIKKTRYTAKANGGGYSQPTVNQKESEGYAQPTVDQTASGGYSQPTVDQETSGGYAPSNVDEEEAGGYSQATVDEKREYEPQTGADWTK